MKLSYLFTDTDKVNYLNVTAKLGLAWFCVTTWFKLSCVQVKNLVWLVWAGLGWAGLS